MTIFQNRKTKVTYLNGKKLEGGGKETNMFHALNNTQRFCLIGKHEKMAWLVRAFLEAETVERQLLLEKC